MLDNPKEARNDRRATGGLTGRGVQILRVDGETISDTRLYYDQVQVMTELGLMPATVTA